MPLVLRPVVFCTLLSLAAPAFAVVTDTDTPTPTVCPTNTVTPTSTATPGSGSWSFTAQPLVWGGPGSGVTGNYGQLSYTAGPDVWSGGLLSITFPNGLTPPDATNFAVDPTQRGLVSGYIYKGQEVDVSVNSLAPAQTLIFNYGYNPGGFYVTVPSLQPTFEVDAYPQSLTLGAGGVVTPVPGFLPLVVLTATPTPTATPILTFTITPTFTISPTFTITPTPTMTWTQSPIADAPAAGFFTYPNPFDMRVYDKVTVRFQPAESAEITVFNLLGEPVRTLPQSDVQPALGWAIWHGDDDRQRPVSGGLYFIRLKTPNGTTVKKFTVLN